MKAAVINQFGSPGVFEMAILPVPEIIDNEVLIEVASGSINPVDWKHRKGNHRFILGRPFPIVLGYDVAGTVIKVGSACTRLRVGDKVCGVLKNKYGGGLCQFAKSDENCFVKVPQDVWNTHLAALPLAGLTALQGLRDYGQIKKGDKVLIVGAAGGVGHFAVQIAQILGGDVTAVTSQKHFDFLNGLGKYKLIDYNQIDILQSNEQFQIIFDVVGRYSFLKCKHLLASGGTYVNTLPRPKILAHKLISLFTDQKKVKTFLMKQRYKDLQLLMDWVTEKQLKIAIDQEFGIEKIGEAHAYSELGHAEGKILIRYTSFNMV
jgi:NADPH:quinone reductase-like Zn-dependent oxidoreductase